MLFLKSGKIIDFKNLVTVSTVCTDDPVGFFWGHGSNFNAQDSLVTCKIFKVNVLGDIPRSPESLIAMGWHPSSVMRPA